MYPLLYRAPYSPREYGSKLALWLDGADQGTMTPGTGIAQWRDKGPRGAHAAQATGASQPTLVAGALNGLPATRYASQHLTGTLTQTGTGCSIFIVANLQTGAASSGRAYAMCAAGASDGNTNGLYIGRDAANQLARLVYGGGVRAAPAVTYNTPFLIGVVFNAAGASVRINGGAETTSAVAPVLASTLYCVGTSLVAGAASNGYWLNDIHEIVHIAATVNEAERVREEGRLAHKWWNGSILDASHAWKAVRPS